MFAKPALLAVAALSLAGCITSSGTTYHVRDPYQFFAHAARGGTLPVMIAGEPFPGQQASVEREVLTALDRNFKSLGKPFKVVPAAPSTESRFVVVFSPAGRPLATQVCAADPKSLGAAVPAGAKVSAIGVYCAETPFSEAWVSLPNPATADSAPFREAMDTLVTQAIPREIDPSNLGGPPETPPQ